MNGPKPKLLVAPCAANAAKYAVEHWHYSKSMPSGPIWRLGVWEDDTFIGVVLFGRGSAKNIGRPFALKQSEIVELARVALSKHRTHVSRILAISTRLLYQNNPGLRLIVSLADPAQEHHGGIYQGAGWSYIGTAGKDYKIRVHGRALQSRTVAAQYNTMSVKWIRANVDPDCCMVPVPLKHKYAIALDKSLQPMLDRMSQPYPKRPKDSSELSGQPAGRGRGSTDPDAPTTEV